MIRKLFSVGALMLVILVGATMSGCERDSDVLEWNTELQQQIKQDYVSHFDDGQYRTVEEIIIHSYYGIYDGSVVLSLSSATEAIIDVFGGSETVAGKTFNYSNPGYRILVWNDGNFYTLTQAFDDSRLTSENIHTIYSQHTN